MSKSHKHRVLGVDPGYDRVGFAVLERASGKHVLIHSECFTTRKTLPFSERLLSLGKRFDEVLSKFKPNVLAIETLFLTKNQKTAMRVAEARGAMLYKAAERVIPIFEYSPLQIKGSVVGYGKGEKLQVSFMVKQQVLLKKEVSSDDEMDAIAVALTHLLENKNL